MLKPIGHFTTHPVKATTESQDREPRRRRLTVPPTEETQRVPPADSDFSSQLVDSQTALELLAHRPAPPPPPADVFDRKIRPNSDVKKNQDVL